MRYHDSRYYLIAKQRGLMGVQPVPFLAHQLIALHYEESTKAALVCVSYQCEVFNRRVKKGWSRVLRIVHSTAVLR